MRSRSVQRMTIPTIHFAVLVSELTDTLEQQRQALEEKTPNNAFFVLMIMAKNYRHCRKV